MIHNVNNTTYQAERAHLQHKSMGTMDEPALSFGCPVPVVRTGGTF